MKGKNEKEALMQHVEQDRRHKKEILRSEREALSEQIEQDGGNKPTIHAGIPEARGGVEQQ